MTAMRKLSAEEARAHTAKTVTNWASFADGEWYEAEQGVDYEDPQRFVNTGRNWAYRHNMLMDRRYLIERVAFRLTPRPAPE